MSSPSTKLHYMQYCWRTVVYLIKGADCYCRSTLILNTDAQYCELFPAKSAAKGRASKQQIWSVRNLL